MKFFFKPKRTTILSINLVRFKRKWLFVSQIYQYREKQALCRGALNSIVFLRHVKRQFQQIKTKLNCQIVTSSQNAIVSEKNRQF